MRPLTSLTSLPQVEASRLATEGIITEQRLQTISLSITSARAQANDLMSSLDRDAPFPYVALCGLLVNINVFIMSTWKGVEWSVWFQSFGGPKLVEQPKWWVDMLVLVSWNVSYKCLYDITYVRLSLFNAINYVNAVRQLHSIKSKYMSVYDVFIFLTGAPVIYNAFN